MHKCFRLASLKFTPVNIAVFVVKGQFLRLENKYILLVEYKLYVFYHTILKKHF